MLSKLTSEMKPRTNGVHGSQRSKSYQGEGSNWILIAGGALLSTLSVRLGYKLKQVLDTRQQENASNTLNGNGKSTDRRKSRSCRSHSNMYSFTQDEDGCFNCMSGNEGMVESKHGPNGQVMAETESTLPLVTVSSAPEFTKENGVIWSTSPDRLELPPKPFLHSNCSDSPCVSESGSDIFTKRDVIHKLRQQLKRRDDMILEMQDQILDLQNSLNAQVSHSTHLQSQLDGVNKDLFDSEREIQRLRKAIADHCVGKMSPNGVVNGHVNGYESGDGERIEMLRREVGELKEVIEGKEYLVQSYKEQKTELAMKVKELQQRLDSQLLNIL